MTKKMLLAVFCTVSFGIVKAQSVPTALNSVPTVTEADVSTVTPIPFYEQLPLVKEVISFAKEHLYTRYRSGGTNTRGFDCSGFTRFCFNHFGLLLPHSSAAQGNVGEAINQEQAQPGDLILFKGHSSKGSHIGHVGLITEVIGDQIKFIHSAWNGGVRYDYLHADYYKRRFMGVRRVAHMLAEN
ncbi:C40 family peptidase [Spirosoma sp. BT702]|uniref:C40 family peptidase n=1 Tax=Spirosoma profusum TaxID=2771354 RepID=A0A926XTZ0_9BACT|nr:C40 family peptidase [Spirosoma profusum]MBD2699346.1 C40 family peptidase [Spirosoma profusum]